MPDAKTCPTCAAPLPADATGGACPKCLLQAGFATGGAPPSSERVPSPEELAPKFPGLVIESVLGRGGMGVVYKARHKALDRDVALKVLPASVAADKAFAERFQREARALAKLQHPNIVGVHDFGVTDGLFWLVMEYVDGANIRQAMKAGTIGPKEALAIVPQICDALQYAHEHGVVHRDIKPENVMLDKSGRVKVADFGLAKMMEHGAAERTLTGAGQVMGTPHYMAPEQVEHPADVDHRADIYSLGVVFYEMLTGELPLGRFAAPSGKCDVDARIDQIVLRTLEKEREARYQQVAQVKTDVGLAAASPRPQPIAAAPAPVARLSKLAVVACLTLPVAFAAIVTLAITEPPLGSPRSYAVGGAVVLLVMAWIASVVAWGRIRRSNGRLRGQVYAAVGTLLPLVLSCLAAPFLAFAPPPEPPRSTTANLVLQTMPPRYGPVVFKLGTAVAEIDAASETPAIEGAFDRMFDAHATGDQAKLFDFYLPDDAATLRAMDPVERIKRGGAGELGLPLYAYHKIARTGTRSVTVAPGHVLPVHAAIWLLYADAIDVVTVGDGTHIARVSAWATDGEMRYHFQLRGRIVDDATGRHVEWFFDNGHVEKVL